MASKKAPLARAPSKDKSVEVKQTASQMKEKIKELEQEVSDLKRKHEELRRAKNNMVVKREREVLQVGEPFGQRGAEAERRTAELQKRLSELQQLHSAELSKLHEQHTKALTEAAQKSKTSSDCGHTLLITSLQERVATLEDELAVTRLDRDETVTQVERLLFELSVKEAEWLEKEQQLKRELQRQWGEKYAEWMQKTESKLAELQQANTMLKDLLQTQRSRDHRNPATNPDD